MRTSDSLEKLAPALVAAQADMPNVPKETVGQVGSQKRISSEGEFRRLAALETDDCVIWPYAKAGQRSYGLVYTQGAKRYAHREALALRTPPPADRRIARHGPCNTPACMNYRHLSWGTSADNNADMRRDGTALTGERNPMSKLTAEDVRGIREAFANCDASQRELAAHYGVGVMTINRAIRRESWRAA